MIIAYSGTHGIGKTTSALFAARDLKINHPTCSVHVLCDLESFCPFPINREGSEKTQAWIFAYQIKQTLSAMARFDIVVCDRSILDVVAYAYALGFHGLAEGMLAMAETFLPYYKEIRIKKIANNPHCHPDGIRDVTAPDFRQAVETCLLDLYHKIDQAGIFPGNFYYA